MIEKIRQFFSFAYAALDGVYGWVDEAIAIAITVIVFNFFAKWLLRWLHRRFEKQKKFWQDGFVRALYKPLSVYVWFFAGIHSLDLISHRIIEETFFRNMHLILRTGALIAFGWFLLLWKHNVIRYLRLKSNKKEIVFDQTKIDVMDKIGTTMIIFLTILVVLEVTGQSMNTLIAFGGIGGLAIAIASQEVIANFFGGIMIYATHPFSIGDWINLPERNIEGHVEEIGWYMTRIRTFEKRPIYVPNATFSKIVVMTPSRMSHRQFNEVVGVRYSDMPAVKAIIQDIKSMLDQHPDIDHREKIIVNLKAFGSYSLDISVRAYTLTIDTEGFGEVKQDILFKIYDILLSYKAELASPTTILEMPQNLTK